MTNKTRVYPGGRYIRTELENRGFSVYVKKTGVTLMYTDPQPWSCR